jgi:hypothetical protein
MKMVAMVLLLLEMDGQGSIYTHLEGSYSQGRRSNLKPACTVVRVGLPFM